MYRFLQILVLLVSGIPGGIHCKRYNLAAGWNSSITSTLKQFEAANAVGNYFLLYAMAEDELILSDRGTFGLSLFSFNGTKDYYLSIVMAVSNYSASAVVVWTGNRLKTVSENAMLHISQNGTFALLDGDSTVWSPRQASPVSGIDLQESGNLVLYNATGGTVWQSFNEPCDVLLEGQVITTGQALVSSSSNSTMAPGNYEVTGENSGIGLFFKPSASVREPYFLWGLWNQRNSPRDVSSTEIVCPTYETVLEYNSSQVSMGYRSTGGGGGGNLQKCGPDLSAPLEASGSLRYRYLKLYPSGKLVQMVYMNSSWVPVRLPSIFLGECLPMGCPSNSICLENGQCECIDGPRGANQCPELSDLPLTCNELEAENHHFMTVPGVSYFSNRYTKEDRISTLEDCQQLCLSNCSCSALIYNNASGSCHFLNEVHGSLTADATGSAFLKLQNSKLVLPKGDNLGKTIWSIAGSIVFFMLVVALLVLWLWRRRMQKLRQTLLAALRGAPHRYTYKELKQATGKFSSELGAGGSGPVYGGVLKDGRGVAIKKLENSNQGEKEFIAEVNTIGIISHVNIVKLCGFCASGPHRMLVYEHVANGSLDKWLFIDENEDGGRTLDWKTRFQVALGAARGLAYLHEESRLLIMHLDVKPQNILLDHHFVAKVADFGMAKLILDREASQVTTTIRGTPGYLAPEWLLNSVATKKCDVYSYGMVLLEIIGGRKNLGSKKPSGISTSTEEDLAWYFPAWAVERIREGKLFEIVDPRIELDEQLKAQVRRVLHIALWCIQGNPASRPSMTMVIQMLEGHKEVLEPPLSFHFAIQSPGVISFSTTSNSRPVVTLSSLK